jgi:hypothetical protein
VSVCLVWAVFLLVFGLGPPSGGSQLVGDGLRIDRQG